MSVSQVSVSQGTRKPVFVLIGGTGDLALRMLYPSLVMLDQDGFLPHDFRVIGCAREKLTREAFAERVAGALDLRLGSALHAAARERFLARLDYVVFDANDAASGTRLKAATGEPQDIDLVVFMATTPSIYKPICETLNATGLSSAPARVIIEKPLGRSLESSKVINDAVAVAFDESRVFRIDHYLGKETVQNLIALRFANAIFEPLWNNTVIDHVQITVAETIGVGERLSYYDDYGAIRDMLQNHMLQLLCLFAMEPPSSLDPDALRDEKLKVLRSLKAINKTNVQELTARGQYGAGKNNEGETKGYEAEKGSPSNTETFVAMQLEIANWRWHGVPFYLRTGKRLDRRCTEIIVQFKKTPHQIFPSPPPANRLVISLQPDEEISLRLINKTPGLTQDGMHLRGLPLSLSLQEDAHVRRRIAYERLLLDALKGNRTLFVRRDEVEAAWKFVDGIIEGWQATGMKPETYVTGSHGPKSGDDLVKRSGRCWHE
ncbi:MAG: glucose-6-phosphate dehydrogenase [Alphaproteobacteria bacterium]|nr:glucose-6-phosphate dehydrogenase [Alphaproteobacteria bacterium]MBV8549005.1 glucose-6-phosphate dehydrogenase [Alphaproteobacteria bacterium]